MKKFTHVLIALTFAFACFSLWSMLTMVIHVGANGSMLPGFTRLCLVGRPVLLLLPVPVIGYCLYVVFRRQPAEQNSITTFLAWTMSALCLVFFPVLIAVFLPCLKFMEG